MSWVANIMVSVTYQDQDNAELFAQWLRMHPGVYLKRQGYRPEAFEPGGVLPFSGALSESPDEVWPGPKRHECHVWLGVLNDADQNAVRDYFATIPWCVPNAVQLFLMDQEEFFFRVWMIRDGQLRQYAPLEPDENDDCFLSPQPP